MRADGRRPDELRPYSFQRRWTENAPGSVLVTVGRTRVLCTAMVEEKVPSFLLGKGRGWVTSEYGMLPGSTPQRRAREGRTGRTDGRTQEIQRLVGRSLRCAVDAQALGERTVWVDCDVLQADGGTRTAAISGGYVALVDALIALRRRGALKAWPLVTSVGAVSVGVLDGEVLLDLDYAEDAAADVDANFVLTGEGRFVELQASAETRPFDEATYATMAALARAGIERISRLQSEALAGDL